MGLTRRHYRALILTGLILGSLVGPAAVGALSGYLSNSGPVQGGGTYQAPSGPAVTLTGNYDINLTDPPESNTLTLRTSEGNITFESNGQANATIAASQINGSWTNLTQLDVASSELRVDPPDKPAVNVTGGTESLSIPDSMAVDDGQVDFVYAGSSGSTTLTLRGLPAGVTIAAYDTNTGSVLDTSMTTQSGVVEFTMPNSEHAVELRTVEGMPTASDIDPEDETRLDYRGGVSFDLNITDTDFPSDSVTARLYLRGPNDSSFTQVYQESVSSNTTVSTTQSLTTGGSYEYYWTLEDSGGLSSTTNSRTVYVPATLEIRTVSSPQSLLTGVNVSANVTLYPKDDSAPITIVRNVNDGTINLTGLPTTGFLVARVEADGYYVRRTLITSIYQQQAIYLLNSSTTAYPITFELQDKTGQYPESSSYLVVRRALNASGSGTDWVAVAGDAFDATGSFRTQLEPDERYQLVVLNDQGDRRVLGYYDPPNQADVEPLPIGSVEISGDIEGQGWSAGAAAKEIGNETVIGYRYFDGEAATSELTIRIYNVSNGQTLLYNSTYSGPIRDQVGSVSFPNQTVTAAYEVVFDIRRNGQVLTKTVDVGGVTGPGFDQIGDDVKLVAGYGIVVLAGLVVVTASSSAAVIVAAIIAELLSVLGIIQVHPVQVGVAMVIGIVYHFASE